MNISQEKKLHVAETIEDVEMGVWSHTAEHNEERETLERQRMWETYPRRYRKVGQHGTGM